MRIVLADHHQNALWALQTMLEAQPEFELIGVSEDAQSLLVFTENHSADLFLVDRELPGSSIGDLIDHLHALDPRPYVIIMSSEFEYSNMILKAGADAFVSKSDRPDYLLDTLHQIEKRFRNADQLT